MEGISRDITREEFIGVESAVAVLGSPSLDSRKASHGWNRLCPGTVVECPGSKYGDKFSQVCSGDYVDCLLNSVFPPINLDNGGRN